MQYTVILILYLVYSQMVILKNPTQAQKKQLPWLTKKQPKLTRNYNPGQKCRDNSCFSPSPHYNVDFSRSPKSRSVHRSLACFNIVWGEGGRKKGSERRTNVAHITMEACTVNSLLLAQNLTSVPKCFDPDCLKLSFIE